YTNVATVSATPPEEPPISHQTPPVEVEVPAEPGFETKKEQRIEGEPAYTTAKLQAKLGQKVEYRISVKDTGNTSLSLASLSDAKCDAGTLVGPSQSPIAPGETATYSCSHVLSSNGVYTNVATQTAEGAGKELTRTSNEVEAEAKREPGFETKKEQRIEGEPAYTTAKLQAKLGQKVEYRISVKDTGNTSLALASLSDAKCDAGTISGPSQSPIAPGESATYSCSHVLSSLGAYTNVATVTATPPGEPPISHETPPVEVEVPAEPGLETKKEQRIEGEPAYTTAKLQAKLGQKVEYRISVKDTGNTSLALTRLTDPKCDAGTLAGPSQSPIAPGETATYSCSHVLSTPGVYTNVATQTAEGAGKELTRTSNEVEAEAKREPGFETKKEQRIEGEPAYTTAKLQAKLGQKVEYRISVKDTGNTSLALASLSDAKCDTGNAPLSISGFSDPHCDAGTLAGGPTKALAASEAATYTCSHVLTSADQSAGSYSNIATDTATPPEGKGAPITLTSNTVVVNVPASPPSTVPTPPSPPA